MVTGAFRIGSVVARDTREQVLSGLFRSHCVELVRLAYCLTSNRERAEEAVQEAYLSLFHNWPLRNEASALAYLRAGVINQCRSEQRRLIRARRGEPLLRASDLWTRTGRDAAVDVVARDEASRLAESVRELPRRHRRSSPVATTSSSASARPPISSRSRLARSNDMPTGAWPPCRRDWRGHDERARAQDHGRTSGPWGGTRHDDTGH